MEILMVIRAILSAFVLGYLLWVVVPATISSSHSQEQLIATPATQAQQQVAQELELAQKGDILETFDGTLAVVRDVKSDDGKGSLVRYVWPHEFGTIQLDGESIANAAKKFRKVYHKSTPEYAERSARILERL